MGTCFRNFAPSLVTKKWRAGSGTSKENVSVREPRDRWKVFAFAPEPQIGLNGPELRMERCFLASFNLDGARHPN